ncbi:MAG TPA: ATP-binding protein [Myxococcota bacterium]|nr:ATP-binding protein [Myxococcota bacterium]
MLLLVLGLIATVTLLLIAALASRRARLDPVARALTLLAADLSVWNLGATLFAATSVPAWHWLDVTFSPLTAPLVLELVLAYVGLARRHRPLRLVAWSYFGLLALSSASAWFLDWGRLFIEGAAWSIIYLTGWSPIFIGCLWLLLREARRLRDAPRLAMPARLLFVALLVAGLLGSTELWNDVLQVPGLGAVGVVLAASLIAAVVFRFGLIARERVAATVYLALLLLVGGVVIAAIATAARGHAIATVLAAVFMTGLVGLAAREVAQGFEKSRLKTLELAGLGRFTAQMSHDLKNPLAAMKGTIQYLQEARAHEPEMLELVAAQITRLETILDRYARLATIRLEAGPLELHDLAFEVARARTVGTAITLRAQDERTTKSLIEGDRDLLASAFENIVTNAMQAMGDQGTLTVTTREQAGSVQVSVSDTGPGIEPRYLERVADDFFTTRAEGSGLGLAFVRRIARAHGGQLTLASEPGRGTTVTIALPMKTRPNP